MQFTADSVTNHALSRPMIRYRLSRLQWALKRSVMVLIHHLLRLRVYWQPARWPAVVNGTVAVFDRCLGIGDVLMISPALRLLLESGRCTVVAHLPRLLDAELSWHTTKSWQEHYASVTRLVAAGNVVLVPFTGLRGALTWLLWRGALPPGIIVLSDRYWIDTVSGAMGSVSSPHYSAPSRAAACALVGRIANTVPTCGTLLRLPPLLHHTASQQLRTPTEPFVALAPWATAATRRWQLAHWARLIEILASCYPHLRFVLLGSADERGHGEAILTQCDNRRAVTNLMGDLSITETAAALCSASLLVCCDSGLMHIALGLNTPVLALFGSTDPATRVPEAAHANTTLADTTLCPRHLAPCYAGLQREPVCPTHIECLSLLQPERVATRALERLATTLGL